MRQLLAYLLVRRSDGSWEVGSHRGLETLLAAWRAVPDAGACGIVHVGFWRPDTAEFEAAAAGRPGEVLLTESARWALPESFRSSGRPVDSAGNLRLHRALTGWGCDREDEEDDRAPSAPVSGSAADAGVPSAEPWLDGVRTRRPDLWRAACEAGISDDGSYLANERLLPFDRRDELGAFRFRWFARAEASATTILPFLAFAPPWLLDVEVSSLLLSTRPANRLAEEKLATVGDVARRGEENLLKIPAMGRRSVAEIAQRIFDAFRSGSAYCSRYAAAAEPAAFAPGLAAPFAEEEAPPAAARGSERVPESFFAGLREALDLCEERDAKVLRLRMGLHGAPQTLDGVGTMFSVTRERIRQIEKKAVGRIVALMPSWVERTDRGVAAALVGREEPLPLVGLEIVDPWFSGVGENGAPLEFAFEHFFGKRRFWLLKVDGQTYVSGMGREAWADAVRKARALLSDLVRGDKSLLEDEARCLAESLLPEEACGLRPLLWATVTRWANFSTAPDGRRHLASFGGGAESVVEAALLESDRPLHYEEIAKRCAARGKALEIRNAHRAAARVGILLAPGVFGLERHFPLDDEETASVVAEAENMLLENPSKQWHSDEIADGLGELGLDFGGRLTKYALNHALRQSKTLVYLGRLVWAVRSCGVRGKADRIGVWQAIVAMIGENGAPMRTEEIRDRLSKDRGLGSTPLLIVQADPLVRVGEGVWGLLWRDVPFSEEEAGRIVAEMEEVCRRSGEGLHLSEVAGALRGTADLAERAKDPILLVSLAVRTGRMKAAKGGYVHPSDWEGSRRLCANEAVAAALAETGDSGWTLAALAARAAGFLGREIHPHVASRLLISAGAVYDEEARVWRRPESRCDTDDEIDADGASEDGPEGADGSDGSEADACSVLPPSDASGAASASTAQGV